MFYKSLNLSTAFYKSEFQKYRIELLYKINFNSGQIFLFKIYLDINLMKKYIFIARDKIYFISFAKILVSQRFNNRADPRRIFHSDARTISPSK